MSTPTVDGYQPAAGTAWAGYHSKRQPERRVRIGQPPSREPAQSLESCDWTAPEFIGARCFVLLVGLETGIRCLKLDWRLPATAAFSLVNSFHPSHECPRTTISLSSDSGRAAISTLPSFVMSVMAWSP